MLHWFSAVLALGAVQSTPVASLRVDADRATFLAIIEEDRVHGYKIQIKCVAKCSHSMSYSEPVGDSPLGLFYGENGLLYSKWAGGSAYRVRVWRVTDKGVEKVGEFASWHREPDFTSDKLGRPAIRVYEGGFDFALTLRPVLWTYIHGRFLRETRNGN